MHAIIQRVAEASVVVVDNGSVVSQIQRGLCVLVGITHEDNQTDLEYIVKKILNTRLFEDESGKPWTKSVKDLGLQVLSVSQFTLFANTSKGNKPDFHGAMKSDSSREFYSKFLEKLASEYQPDKIADGQFGAYMQVKLVNDGPVTIIIDSKAPKG